MEVRYPPPQKGYLRDTCAIPYENKANGCDTPICDTVLKGYCAIWGFISHWAAKVTLPQYARSAFQGFCGVTRGGQQHFATQILRVHLLGMDFSPGIGNGVGRQGRGNQPPPLSTIRTRYGNSVSTPGATRTGENQQKSLQKGSRYGISVSTPHRRYGHRLRTPFFADAISETPIFVSTFPRGPNDQKNSISLEIFNLDQNF